VALSRQFALKAAQGADVLRDPAAQQAAMTFGPTNSNVTPITAVVPPTTSVVPPSPPITPPIVSLSNKPISATTWLRFGIPKSPFNILPYSRARLETAWQSFNMPCPNIYKFPVQDLVIVRLHFLSTLWRPIQN